MCYNGEANRVGYRVAMCCVAAYELYSEHGTSDVDKNGLPRTTSTRALLVGTMTLDRRRKSGHLTEGSVLKTGLV